MIILIAFNNGNVIISTECIFYSFMGLQKRQQEYVVIYCASYYMYFGQRF
jgi:hypothetical protein